MNSDDLISVGRPDPNNHSFVVPGATVWLNSGGPPLRVIHVGHVQAHVAWWNNDDFKTQIGVFPVACLTPEPGGQS